MSTTIDNVVTIVTIVERSCNNDKTDIQSFTTKVDSSVSEIKSSVSRLESKFKDLLVSIDSKFEVRFQ